MSIARKVSRIIVFVFFILAGCVSEPPPPNIVLIMTDDQGYGDFGFTGNEYVQTPVIDEFKMQSLYFDRFYVSPVCAPTRASLLTGRYHLRTGTTWVTHGKEVMRSEEKTIAEALKEHGYTTGCFGKWHNGKNYPHNPNGQGFDTFFGFSAGHWNNYFDTPLEYNGKMVQTEGYIVDVLTDSAIVFIESNRNNPFFCYVPFNTPHGPFQIADHYFDKYSEMGLDAKNAAVYGMCENIDDNFGRILMKLRELELEDNTIVLFLTDNGPNGHRYNAGMSGIKGNVDEGGVRVPLLIRYPGVLPAGDTVNGLASHIDILPTLMGLAGLVFNPVLPIDGIDLSSYMVENKSIDDRLIFSHQVNNILQPTPSSVRTPEHRLVLKDGDTLLYNMIVDPGQKHDISADNPELTRYLLKEHSNWYADVTEEGTEVPAIQVGHKEAPEVTLSAIEADLSENIQFKGGMGWANDWLIGFDSDESVATWDLDVVSDGFYDIYVKLACNEPVNPSRLQVTACGITVELDISKSYNAPLVPGPDRIVRKEVYEREWPLLKIGTLGLNRDCKEIAITYEGVYGINLELKELLLIAK